MCAADNLKDNSNSKNPRLRWGVEKRLEFIDFRLYWDGRINRSDLTEFFDISIPQASVDLRLYDKQAPGNMAYDRNAKCYFATGLFKPRLISPGSESYINELHSVDLGLLTPESTFINKIPSFSFLPKPRRSIEPSTLFRIHHAINDQKAIEIEYQSMSSPNPVKRWISPHAIAYDNYRWHIRAFCHERLQYRDFVFGRIVALGEVKETEYSSIDDKGWNTFVTVRICPNPACSKMQQLVTEYDYNMENGKSELEVRVALLFYFLRTYGLNKKSDDSNSANTHHLVLDNEEDLKPYLDNM